MIILGAGRPHRGEDPSALVFTSANKRVLDWVIDAFAEVPISEMHFVGGFRLDEVIRFYPNLHFSVNPNWKTSGSVGSLLSAPLTDAGSVYVSYSDILFSRNAVEKLQSSEGDVVVLIDRQWKKRFSHRTESDLRSAEKIQSKGSTLIAIGKDLAIEKSDAEFVGLLKLSEKAIQFLNLSLRFEKGIEHADLPKLITRLKDSGLVVQNVEVEGEWAELNETEDLAQFILGTKAETLERLRPLVRQSRIGEQVSFTVGEWRMRQEAFVGLVRKSFGNNRVIVRSSAVVEDSATASCAGQFESVLNVSGSDDDEFVRATEKVIASYPDSSGINQVLVQEMLEEVQMSGVVLTRTLNQGAPYYVFNYDDVTHSTESVTSGLGRDTKTVLIARAAPLENLLLSARLLKVLNAIKELEALVGYDALDIEFAVDRNGQVVVFQLRRIAANQNFTSVSDEDVHQVIQSAVNLFKSRQAKPPHLHGDKTLFGVMPDWNPAEIVGTRPGKLALSLYQFLVTDEVWATQRAEFGYRDVRPAPLLCVFAGHPYVDVRCTFNSFIPAHLPDALQEKLVNYYLNRLKNYPHFHDKVEFEVAFTCFTFDFEMLAKKRLAISGFTEDEIGTLKSALIDLTKSKFECCETSLAQIEILKKRFEATETSSLPTLSKVRLLLEDCKRFGTLPFAHLARLGFVAISLLRSLESLKVITSAERESFLNSLNTVTRQFERDGSLVAHNELSWEEFKKRYGHLRPGTYEITSQSYRENAEQYLKHMVKKSEKAESAFVWNVQTRKKIEEALSQSQLGIEFEAFEKFLRNAIEGREYAKFVFTRNISLALDKISEFGLEHRIEKEKLSHLSLNDLMGFQVSSETQIQKGLERLADAGLFSNKMAHLVELPPILTSENDFLAFERMHTEPNFVTHQQITGEISLLQDGADKNSLRGKIILIPQADPGYDWLFGYQIKGLITMYGGSNSHMTIRAAELGLPAAIGIGEELYEELKIAKVINLDCKDQKLKVIQ